MISSLVEQLVLETLVLDPQACSFELVPNWRQGPCFRMAFSKKV